MACEKIHILVEQSRDSGWSKALVDLEPDDIYITTDNRDYLKWSVLKNYDVVTICGYSPLEYRNDEIYLIKKFVENGGGLLLASSSSRYQKYVDDNVYVMRMNKIARIFGAEFLPLESCSGEIVFDGSNLLDGYHKKSLRMLSHPALKGLDLEYIPVANCCIISVPDNGEVFLENADTKEPVGAFLKYGKGRIVIINDLEFSYYNLRLCKTFIDWLSCNHISRIKSNENVPDEISLEYRSKEDNGIFINYNDFTNDRVDKCLEFAKTIKTDIINKFPKGEDASYTIEINNSAIHRFNWGDSIISIGVSMNDAKLAYALGVEMASQMDFGSLGQIIWYAGFSFDVIRQFFGLSAMKLLGYEKEAEEIYQKIFDHIEDKDFDITKTYIYHPKSLWILNKIIKKYGDDSLVKLVKAATEKDKDFEKILKPGYFSEMDIFIYFLSRGLETDLYPWFKEIGTTMHPLPIKPFDSDEFKSEVPKILEKAIADRNQSASERNKAICSLIRWYIDIKKPQKEIMTDLKSENRYKRTTAAMYLSTVSDSRAVSVLEDIACNDEDLALSAIASLALVRHGINSAKELLLDTAREQDYLFQLDAVYALQKAGCKISLDELKDKNGKNILSMDIEYEEDHLRMFPTIQGRRVANIYMDMDSISHFPGNIHVNGAYVQWVHTHPAYRRKGLSRWTMKQMMEHPLIKNCSCAYLHTGTRNNAHAMYRSFGFIDVGQSFHMTGKLKRETAKVVEGINIRDFSPGDEVKMTEIARETYSDMLDVEAIKIKSHKNPGSVIKVAEKDSGIIGFTKTGQGHDKKEAILWDLHVKETDNRKGIGMALLCATHNNLLDKGFTKILMFRGDLAEKKYIRDILLGYGYQLERSGGVKMFKMINLPMLLKEISSLLSKRIKDSDYKLWSGKINIIGKKYRACIDISESEVKISDKTEKANINLSAHDDIITSMIAGRITPYEAYLQIKMTIKPMVNEYVIGLLETLFPRMPKER
ncbi:GNAT family N-acetyltransferase [Candidatus Poribacteria bacterium]|nr:GNAT family N-acetyltransferase [Candidatus Poribacteria bacterium]